MKKSIIFMLLFFLIYGRASLAATTHQQLSAQAHEQVNLDEIEQQIRDDFRLFLQEIYNERDRSRKGAETVIKEMTEILGDTKTLIDDSRKEIRDMSYSETKNLLVASIFLWVSITIFIVMNLVFANNLKKELYFLRNGLLRSEIKDNMINLSKQLSDLNEKLESINKE